MRIFAMGVAAALCAASVASAQDTGFYVSGHLAVGISDTMDEDVDGIAGSFDEADDESVQVNLGLGGALGYDFAGHGAPVRVELGSIWHYRHDLDGDVMSGGFNTNLKSDIQTVDVMISALWDIDIGAEWITPYVGGGVGLAFNEADTRVRVTNAAGVVTLNEKRSKNTTSFAWAVRAGASFPLSDRLDLDAGYRFAYLGEVESGRFSTGAKGDAELIIHDFLIGLRFAF